MKHTKVDIDVLVANAEHFITPVWPIETFIACNPLLGFEDLSFAEALLKSQSLMTVEQTNPGLDAVNIEMIKWLGAFLDLGQATIAMPNRELGFYHGFCQLALHDTKLHQDKKSLKLFLADAPKKPQDAIMMCLERLNINAADYEAFLLQNFYHLPGWAGYVKWISLWNNSESLRQQYPINLVEFMAVRLLITCLLWQDAKLVCNKKDNQAWSQQQLERIKTNEARFQESLTQKLSKKLKNLKPATRAKDAQLVFCIDVRSESFRRQIEAIGHYETLGFAGFFGLPVRVHDVDKKHYKDCCPALIRPRFEVDTKLDGDAEKIAAVCKRQDFLTTFLSAYQQLKYNFTTPLNLADIMGPWCGLAMLAKNFMPETMEKWLNRIQSQEQTGVELKVLFDSIPTQEQIAYAKTALELMGLTKHFAKLVVFCGHGSLTTNNPYASALDCGACGGNHGADNAKLLASILNQDFVRDALKTHGIHIPDDTEFLAAEHNTTTDELEIFAANRCLHPMVLQKLKQDLLLAKQNNNALRLQSMPGSSSATRRGCDWSEVRPEWGLARNAGFIVGPRHLTEGLDLQARCFLHSYDWQIDDKGQLLETILTAPMVVAEWINTQYLFSTLDNVSYGSGSKVTHNVVGKLGIMQGNSSDLMHGLAMQSVNIEDHKAYHQPQRLLTVVYAPRTLLDSIIARQPVLQKLFYNQWVHLIVIEPHDHQLYQLNQNGTFQHMSNKEEIVA